MQRQRRREQCGEEACKRSTSHARWHLSPPCDSVFPEFQYTSGGDPAGSPWLCKRISRLGSRLCTARGNCSHDCSVPRIASGSPRVRKLRRPVRLLGKLLTRRALRRCVLPRRGRARTPACCLLSSPRQPSRASTSPLKKAEHAIHADPCCRAHGVRRNCGATVVRGYDGLHRGAGEVFKARHAV